MGLTGDGLILGELKKLIHEQKETNRLLTLMLSAQGINPQAPAAPAEEPKKRFGRR
jgi:hypothetical protein